MRHAFTEYDLGVAWTWEYDKEFVSFIETAARSEGVSTYLIHPQNVEETLARLLSRSIHVRFLLDRASDEDEAFHPLHQFLVHRAPGDKETHVINPLERQLRAADKATMHLEFLSHGINVPYTLIISPYIHAREPEFSLTELHKLGRPFIIKPANTTGGGVGVVLGAETLKDVLEARQHHKNDKYLLQETVKPAYLSEKRAWFRVIYAFGSVFPCWWDDQTHVYEEVTRDEEEAYGLSALSDLAARIRQVCGLEFFSSEIAYTTTGKYVVVDYVNEICDMRPKSVHRDGVPDRIVRSVAESLIRFLQSR
jgi:glutathione synthase/RimK-type ligase-like ATP-grasp enzyme